RHAIVGHSLLSIFLENNAGELLQFADDGAPRCPRIGSAVGQRYFERRCGGSLPALIRRLVVTESRSRHVRQRGRHRASARTSREAQAMLVRHATLVAERPANPPWNQA